MLQNLARDDEIAGGISAGPGIHDVQARLAMEESVLIIEALGENLRDRSPIAKADPADIAIAGEFFQRKAFAE